MGNMFRKLLWLLIVGSVAFAVLRLIPWGHPNDAWQWLTSTANSFGAWVKGLVDSLHLSQLPKVDHPIELPSVSSAPVAAPAG